MNAKTFFAGLLVVVASTGCSDDPPASTGAATSGAGAGSASSSTADSSSASSTNASSSQAVSTAVSTAMSSAATAGGNMGTGCNPADYSGFHALTEGLYPFGEPVNMCEYDGEVVLVVNTAAL